MAAEPPVRLLARRRVAENSKWRVHFDHIVDDHGNRVEDFLVVEPKVHADGLVSGVTVLPVLEDGRVVLLRAYRHAIDEWLWEAPRGFVDPGETAAAAARRELAEETGLAGAADQLRQIAIYAPEASTIAGKIAVFVARGCRPVGAVVRDEPGLGVAHRFSAAGLEAMVARFEIQDPGTLAAVQAVLRPSLDSTGAGG